MKKILGLACLAAVSAVGVLALWTLGVEKATDRAFATSASSAPATSKPLAPGQKVTFLELGSVGCKPCEAMKPVMAAVRERYGEQVEVTFHDVKVNRSIAREWGVHLIPTQIFLNAEGKEAFRHEGYLALEDVEGVLRKLGVRSSDAPGPAFRRGAYGPERSLRLDAWAEPERK